MRIGRVVPPAAAPLRGRDLWHGAAAVLRPRQAVAHLEEDLRVHLGVRDVFLVSSGTAALTIALAALHALSPRRRRVIIPAYTCFSVPAAVVGAGLIPVPCDINPTTFDYDFRLLERAVDEETLGVVVHHLFGIPADLARARSLCRRGGAALVEDAAQAMGGRTECGELLGTVGDVGVFSFGRGKNVTCGAGGLITTNSAAIAARLAPLVAALPAPAPAAAIVQLVLLALMALFLRPTLYWIPASIPALGLGRTVYPERVALRRLSGMQAGVLRQWHARVAEWNRARIDASSALRRTLGAAAPPRAGLPYLRLPVLAASRAERDRLLALSRQRGLGMAPGYPTAVGQIRQLRHLLADRRFPAACGVAARLLTLPTHPLLSEGDRQAIADCLTGARAEVLPLTSMQVAHT